MPLGRRFHLFTQMDQDKSGRVTYVEFLEMVRSDAAGLALRPAQLPDYQLQSLWRALDDDGSGFETEEEDDDAGDGDEDASDDGDDGPGPQRAAAAMVVGVGSWADPPETQGCAHFLEHLLFLGSEKYPDENAYDAFLSKHGGSSNAKTSVGA